MTNPKTGWITREWEVEQFATVGYTKGGVVLSSIKHPVVSEVVFLNAAGTLQVLSATIIAHDRRIPDQGSVGATLAGTLAPQQFVVGLYGVGGSEIGTIAGGTTNGTVTSLMFLVRGH